MERAASLELEASLLQRWFPASVPGKETRMKHERLSEMDLRGISDVLRRVGQGAWSCIPRIYAVLRLLDRLDVIDLFLTQAISDIYFPFTHQTLPQSLNPSVAHEFLQMQPVVLSSALDLERETGRHRHFSSADDVPFIKVEELGKGAYGYVDRVISTISYKEYARKLIPRGRTFHRNRKILRDFERELGTLKKLRHHQHIVQLIGSYTDPRFVGIVMSPVADCDLKDFLDTCTADANSRRSFIRTFFGCLTSALSYLHDNTIRHKDIKPQNVLVSQHTVYLTDFGISLDWSEVGQSTTTGPTPKTARYCAPEVSDYAPRNTSSDMWSLGCIFLEIWTVLKGETVVSLHTFLEGNGSLSSCYHLNGNATSDWVKHLESRPTLADSPPGDWIRRLLVKDKDKRWTARQLLSEIETASANPEAKFAFSGQCCMAELESAESVVSSNGSFYEHSASGPVPQSLPPATPLPPILDKVEQLKAPPGASMLQPNATTIDPNDNISYLSPISHPSDNTMLIDESIITPLGAILGSILKDEENILMDNGESLERNSHIETSEETPDPDQTLLKCRVGGLSRTHLTHTRPVLSHQPALDPSSLPITKLPSVEYSPSFYVSNESDRSLTSKAVSPTIETEKAQSDDLDENSTASAGEYIEGTPYPPSTNTESVPTSPTGDEHDIRRQYGHFSDTVEIDLLFTAPEYPINRTGEQNAMDLNAPQIPLSVIYQPSSTLASKNGDTSIQLSNNTATYSLPEKNILINLRDAMRKDSLLQEGLSQTSHLIPYSEGGTQRGTSGERNITRPSDPFLNEPEPPQILIEQDQITLPLLPMNYDKLRDSNDWTVKVAPQSQTVPRESPFPVSTPQPTPPVNSASDLPSVRSHAVPCSRSPPATPEPVELSRSILHTDQAFSSLPTTACSEDTPTHEIEYPSQNQLDHNLESQNTKIENSSISIRPHLPPEQQKSLKESSSSPLPFFSPAMPLSNSSCNEDLQDLGLTKSPSTDVVSYDSPAVSGVKNRKNHICGKCYEQIPGKFVRALSETFHLECFTCADCGKFVGTKFFPIPGKIIGGKFLSVAKPLEGHTQEIPLCETDYFRRLDLLCHTCGGALRAQYITALGHKYHSDHFLCLEPGCGVSFEYSKAYYEHEGAAYCRRHYVQYARICHGCGLPIFDDYIEQFHNEQIEHWHENCYMIYKSWNVKLKNEFADFFAERQIPKQNDLDVTQELVEASMDRTEKLIAKIWSVLSAFEESCATSLSNMHLHTSKSDVLKALSASGYLVVKIGRYFLALDELHKLKQAEEMTGLPIEREQRLLCKKLVALFSLTASASDIRLRRELLSPFIGLARYLKHLIRIGLRAAVSLDPYNERTIVLSFLANVEEAMEAKMEVDLQQRLQHGDYLSHWADLCALCQMAVDVNPGQGCYWTHTRIYHIDCTNCPSCNGPPKLVYADGGKIFVECSRCNYGSMMAFLSQNFGQNLVILDSRSLVFAHLLYVALARLASVVEPNIAPSLMFLGESYLEDAQQQNIQEGSANNEISPLQPFPMGWKAYWSTSARKYLPKDFHTRGTPWELSTLGESSNNQDALSRETVLDRPAAVYNTQNPEQIGGAKGSSQSYFMLDDIIRIVAVEQARAKVNLQTHAPGIIFDTTSQPSRSMNSSNTTSHMHSQSSQIDLLTSDGTAQIEFSKTDSRTKNFGEIFDALSVPVEEKKGSFLHKWRRKKSRGFL